ncbi:MAG TPA: exo-beta-N-acetylmuramidase NamZ domain-containing protein [Pyrinomonadaceae bacterium]|jgi:uncharacterized protein YbbC (DUF1343 family)/CubicO group peptidase (beta-lactamase class C family)
MKFYKVLFLFAFCLLPFAFANAQGLPLAAPQTVGMSAEKLKLIDVEIEKAIADKKTPGAVVIIGHKGKIVYRKAFGNRALVPTVEKMTVDTIFDAASLTKPISTATSIMILLERGQLRLSDRIEQFIPELKGKDSGRVTIQQLLTHTSGYQPDFDLREKWTGNEGMLKALEKEPLRQPAGTRFVYSDIGFIVLGEIVNRISGKRGIPNFGRENIFQKMKMKDSNFTPTFIISGITNDETFPEKEIIARIAPTENIKNQQSYLGGQFEGKDGDKILRGLVHDPTAYRMNGVAGHAGLFSTADDLARYCQMILNGGTLDNVRVLSANTVALMTKPYVVSETGATRGLGWDMNTSFSGNRGELFPLGSFGHTGFTGTGVWIDPVSQTFVVFMSNRVHPDGKGDVSPIRNKVATIAASAINDSSPEKVRAAEADYQAQIVPQVENFKANLERQRTTNNEQRATNAVVLNGIDVLEKENFKRLENMRVGLVTNHTGKNLSGKQTIDILFGKSAFKLAALFSPEHGIRGQLDVEKISDSTDEKTGLPVFSLYGETRRPKPEHFKDLDAIVFDIQDVGARFYTYISTLQNVIEEAAKAGKPVFVLDRPNPINGVDVEGAVADANRLSFIATHTIPVRHGMTVGELAQMINAERSIKADLRVVKMENWQRSFWFDQTNQLWVNPSPNMRSLTEATLYPGIGLLETTNLSVGRGTDTPFEIIGAPWLDGQKLAEYLNNRNIAGARFVPRRFTPNASVFKGEECSGVNIIIIERARFRPVRTGIEIAIALKKLFPENWKSERYQNLLVNKNAFDRVQRADSPEEIETSWASALEDFKKRRAQFLLY